MIGHEQIISCRKAGQKPQTVWLMLEGRPRVLGDVRLSDADSRPDFRFLVGLDVVLIAPSFNERVKSLWAQVKAAKPSFAVLAVLSAMDAIKWMPGQREIKLEERWHG